MKRYQSHILPAPQPPPVALPALLIIPRRNLRPIDPTTALSKPTSTPLTILLRAHPAAYLDAQKVTSRHSPYESMSLGC